MSLWNQVHELFEKDDGSLPDIFVENLSQAEIISVYEWVMLHASVSGTPNVWSIVESRDVPLSSIQRPAKAIIEKAIEVFRHGLGEFFFAGQELLELTICVEPGGVSFDYRKGANWNEQRVNAFFAMLAEIRRLAPQAVIFQAEEGNDTNPSKSFDFAFHAYIAGNA